MEKTAKELVDQLIQENNYVNNLSKKFYDFLKSTFDKKVNFQRGAFKNKNKIMMFSFIENAEVISIFFVKSDRPYWNLKDNELILAVDSKNIANCKYAYKYALKLFNNDKNFEPIPEIYIDKTNVKFSDISFDKDGNFVKDDVWNEIQRQIKNIT